MPVYSYKAIDEEGARVRGKLTAANENDLFEQLKQSGMHMIDCSHARESQFSFSLGARVTARDRIQLCLHLQQLQAAGVPLIESLEDVRDSTENRRLKDIVSGIVRNVAEGASLSDAFGEYPKTFGTVFTALIGAGEESGNLAESFGQLVHHQKWSEAVNSRIKKASRYPTFMLLVMFLLYYFMMTQVVPQLVSFFLSTGQELPPATRSLIVVSNFTQNYSLYILLAPVVVFVGYKLLRLSERVSLFLDGVVLRLPVIGKTVEKITMSRFAHFFSIMFKSGVPILRGLETAQKVVVNRKIHADLDRVRLAVNQGDSLSHALDVHGSSPPLVVRMVKIGEDSGRLAETLENVTDFYDREVEETVDKFISMVEPTLTMSAGLLMLWIVFGIVGPIYDSFEQLDF